MLHSCKSAWKSVWSMVGRRKVLNEQPSQLARVLGLIDLTAIGVGSTLGLGVYVLAGSVARTTAGPAVIISFAIAAIASFFAGLCYAEFAARVPLAGSAYVYAYVAVGEAVAFIIGWTLILEYAIGTASVSRGLASYVDTLLDKSISNYLNSTIHMDIPYLASYPDLFSFAIIAVMTILMAVGVKESSIVNNIFTLLNLLTVSVALVAGGMNANIDNWNISLDDIPESVRPEAGTGGFMPFGIKGIIAGAATCFFGYVGFDCISTTSEEAKNPRRNIPLAIIMSLVIICAVYCSIATILTLMWPYYDQDTEAPFTYVFNVLDMTAVRWIVTIGATFALASSLLGCMFPLPRVMYAMSQDGLLFSFLGRVHGRTQTPLFATTLGGLISGIMALLFKLDQLIEMMSIGTLLAYSIVALCVLVLRFSDSSDPSDNSFEKKRSLGCWGTVGALFNKDRASRPTPTSSGISGILVSVYSLLALAVCVVMSKAGDSLYTEPGPWVGPLVGAAVPLIVVLVLLWRQPQASVSNLSFSVPLLPLIPAISIFMNFYLMVELDVQTWIRFGVWMVAGLLVYFSYSIRHSVERQVERVETLSQYSANGISSKFPQKPEVTTHL